MSRMMHGDFTVDPGNALPPGVEQGRIEQSPGMMAELAQARRRFEATFQHAPVGIAHVALDGRFLMVNPRFCAISGYDADTLIRTGFQPITHPDDLHADEALLARLNAGELPRYAMEKRYIRADGTIIWVKLTVAMVRDDAGEPEFYVGVIEDLSELRQASFEAMHDPLTGLLNRRGFAGRGRDLLNEAARAGQGVALLFLDLDGFKQLNDDLGHGAGDDCLVAVARRLQAAAREGEVVARLGGDEFLMMAAGLGEGAACASAERVRVGLADCGSGISGSIGLVVADRVAADDLDRLVACADQAMRGAKQAGKNRVRVARLS